MATYEIVKGPIIKVNSTSVIISGELNTYTDDRLIYYSFGTNIQAPSIAGSDSMGDWGEKGPSFSIKITNLIPDTDYDIGLYAKITSNTLQYYSISHVLFTTPKSSIVYRINPNSGDFENYRAYIWENTLKNFVDLIFDIFK